jgi:feruloyl esterase
VFGGDTGASGSTPSNLRPSDVCFCSCPPATSSYAEQNAILALIQWVEHGIAPDQIIGSGTNFTRPLCPYPKVSKLTIMLHATHES